MVFWAQHHRTHRSKWGACPPTYNLMPNPVPPQYQATSEGSTGRKEPLFSRFPKLLLSILHVTLFHREEIDEPAKVCTTHLFQRSPSPLWFLSMPSPQAGPRLPCCGLRLLLVSQTQMPMEGSLSVPSGRVLLVSLLYPTYTVSS